MEAWLEHLLQGNVESAWNLFIDRYRRLIFSSIRHFTHDPDEVMDVFAHVCANLSADGMARLRRYSEAPAGTARFTTWLVTVVRNQTVDWFRQRDGRPRPSIPDNLSPLERVVFQQVIIDGVSHEACYQALRLGDGPVPSTHEFTEALRATYRVARVLPATSASHADMDVRLPMSADSDALAQDAVRHLSQALETLDPADRLAIQLFVLDELAAVDVARIVGWPSAKTVYNRVSRALKALRRVLETEGIRRDDL